MAELLLTLEQAAARLQLTPYTVRKHLRARKLRGFKRGRVWRVPESALSEPEPQTPRPLDAAAVLGMTPADRARILERAAAAAAPLYERSLQENGELTAFTRALQDEPLHDYSETPFGRE